MTHIMDDLIAKIAVTESRASSVKNHHCKPAEMLLPNVSLAMLRVRGIMDSTPDEVLKAQLYIAHGALEFVAAALQAELDRKAAMAAAVVPGSVK